MYRYWKVRKSRADYARAMRLFHCIRAIKKYGAEWRLRKSRHGFVQTFFAASHPEGAAGGRPCRSL